MNAEQLAEWLADRLPQIPKLNLTRHTRVTYVMNWGGFVNHSFSIEDGAIRYHLKLANDFDSARLHRWHQIHHLLSERYRAPEVIDWLEFPEIGLSGLLQQKIDGQTANYGDAPALLEQLIELVTHLHKDADLRSHLNASGSTKTYLDHFVETYIDRFNADMEQIVGGQLPFVLEPLLEWMRDETDRLRAIADSMETFHIRVREPVHGDLHENNVLVTSDEWFVLDWDDLALGDPALDFAVLVWPVVFKGSNGNDFYPPDATLGFVKRFEHCLRAQLFDEVIDPLADYVAAATVPSKQAEVQRVKREQHERALEQYRARW